MKKKKRKKIQSLKYTLKKINLRIKNLTGGHMATENALDGDLQVAPPPTRIRPTLLPSSLPDFCCCACGGACVCCGRSKDYD